MNSFYKEFNEDDSVDIPLSVVVILLFCDWYFLNFGFSLFVLGMTKVMIGSAYMFLRIFAPGLPEWPW